MTTETTTETVVTIDLTNDDTTKAAVSGLDAGARERLLLALQNVATDENTPRIWAEIREVLAEDAPGQEVIGVRFTTTPYPHGYYLSSDGDVLFADGTYEEFDFGDNLRETFTGEYGCRSEGFTLRADLRDTTLDTWDSYHACIHILFDLPDPLGCKDNLL